MSADLPSPEVTIWTDAARAEVVRQVVDLMGSAVTPIGVGGPRVAEVSAAAGHFEVEQFDDFRQMAVDRPAAYVLVGAWSEVGRDDVRAALAGGSTLLALEPAAATLDAFNIIRQSRSAGAAGNGGRIVPVPAFMESHGWASAADPREALGRAQMITFMSLGAHAGYSLFARLMDAWSAVLHFANLPQTIDASLTGPLTDVPDDLRGLTGHLLAHTRIDSQCSALIQTSDQVGRTVRVLRVIGDEGYTRVDDRGYQLHTREGDLLDENPPLDDEPALADLIVAQWQRLLDRRDLLSRLTPGTEQRDGEALACCLACQLSARTGQPESPRTILQMHGL